MMYSVLNLFPIQFLSLAAYMILRIVVGYCFVYLGLKHIGAFKELRQIIKVPFWPFGTFNTVILIVFEIVVGLMFVFGAYTQLAALLSFVFCLKMIIWHKRWQHRTIPPKIFYFLLIGCSLSLLITGAGAFAVDLPI